MCEAMLQQAQDRRRAARTPPRSDHARDGGTSPAHPGVPHRPALRRGVWDGRGPGGQGGGSARAPRWRSQGRWRAAQKCEENRAAYAEEATCDFVPTLRFDRTQAQCEISCPFKRLCHSELPQALTGGTWTREPCGLTGLTQEEDPDIRPNPLRKGCVKNYTNETLRVWSTNRLTWSYPANMVKCSKIDVDHVEVNGEWWKLYGNTAIVTYNADGSRRFECERFFPFPTCCRAPMGGDCYR